MSNDVEVGQAIGSVVGNDVALVSVGSTDAHRQQVTAGLRLAGVQTDVPSRPMQEFASAVFGADHTARQPAPQRQPALRQSMGFNA